MGNVAVESCPRCHGAGEHNPVFYAVVLAVPDECTLLKVAAKLDFADIAHVLIREPDSPYGGAATAIGLLPVDDRREVRRVLGKLKPLKELKRKWTSPYSDFDQHGS